MDYNVTNGLLSMSGGYGVDISNSSVATTQETQPDCTFYQLPYLKTTFHHSGWAARRTQVRFFLTGIFGTTLALVGIASNVFVFYVFTFKLNALRNNLCYLAVLAVVDILVEITFILVFPMRYWAELFESVTLMHLWYQQIMLTHTLAQVALSSSTMLVVASSIERVAGEKRKFTAGQRALAVACALMFALLLKGTLYLEQTIVWKPECGNDTLALAMMDQTSFLADWYFYQVVWRFWVRYIGHIMGPFVLLIGIHSWLLYAHARNKGLGATHAEMALALAVRRRGTLSSRETLRQRRRKSARQMLVAVVATYMATHTLNVITAIWEFVDFDGIASIADGAVYEFLPDAITLVTVACGALRLPLYCCLNDTVWELDEPAPDSPGTYPPIHVQVRYAVISLLSRFEPHGKERRMTLRASLQPDASNDVTTTADASFNLTAQPMNGDAHAPHANSAAHVQQLHNGRVLVRRAPAAPKARHESVAEMMPMAPKTSAATMDNGAVPTERSNSVTPLRHGNGELHALLRFIETSAGSDL